MTYILMAMTSEALYALNGFQYPVAWYGVALKVPLLTAYHMTYIFPNLRTSMNFHLE